MDTEKYQEGGSSAPERFRAYLRGRNMRCTSERFAILDAVMATNEHFSVETFGERLEASGFHVSVATLYNTFELLCEAGLLRRHRLDHKSAEYERVLPGQSHVHLICTGCGSVTEVRDPEVAARALQTGRHGRFSPSYFTLYIYGQCQHCRRRHKNGGKRKGRKPATD